TDPSQSIQIARMAVEARLFPLFEVERQQYRINYRPASPIPTAECLQLQGRFKHLFRPENEQMLQDIQEHTDAYWDRLLKLEEISRNPVAAG
ncbi:MAG: hypothetical protein KBC60_03290, partial [Haliscomenobacter sp.]|nr:hypothetical protein [Haliscomenobacter sp.]